MAVWLTNLLLKNYTSALAKLFLKGKRVACRHLCLRALLAEAWACVLSSAVSLPCSSSCALFSLARPTCPAQPPLCFLNTAVVALRLQEPILDPGLGGYLCWASTGPLLGLHWASGHGIWSYLSPSWLQVLLEDMDKVSPAAGAGFLLNVHGVLHAELGPGIVVQRSSVSLLDSSLHFCGGWGGGLYPHACQLQILRVQGP